MDQTNYYQSDLFSGKKIKATSGSSSLPARLNKFDFSASNKKDMDVDDMYHKKLFDIHVNGSVFTVAFLDCVNESQEINMVSQQVIGKVIESFCCEQ